MYAGDKELYGVVLEGYIKIPATDLYHFYLSSDDGSMLYVDGEKLVDNNGLHGLEEVKGTKAVAAGYHRIEGLNTLKNGEMNCIS